MHQFEVSSAEQGMGLLAFLRARLKDAPSVKALKRAIDSKCCTVNGRVEIFSSYVVSKGDQVAITLSSGKKSQTQVETLYEDEELLICNKPAGIASEEKAFAFPPVHRLDKETTGVLILAKNPSIAKQMVQLFKKREVYKEYLALVDGLVSSPSGKIDNYLEKKFAYEGQTVWTVAKKKEGLHAITHWKRLSMGQDASLLLCMPKTGRTHQLRVHLSSIGHPILGDHQYGKQFTCKLRPERHLLHASLISFVHPITQKEIRVTAPIPDDFNKALQVLTG